MTKKIEVELPVIPREVAEAIELIKGCHGVECAVRVANNSKFNYEPGTHTWTLASYGEGRRAEVSMAVLCGYNVEKTAEEIAEEKRKTAEEVVRERYDSLLYNAFFTQGGGHAKTALDTLKWTLDTLGIEIEGVNA